MWLDLKLYSIDDVLFHHTDQREFQHRNPTLRMVPSPQITRRRVAPATSTSRVAISVLRMASVGLRRCTSTVCSSSGWRLCAVVLRPHEKNTESKVERANECRNAPLKYRSAARLYRLAGLLLLDLLLGGVRIPLLDQRLLLLGARSIALLLLCLCLLSE